MIDNLLVWYWTPIEVFRGPHYLITLVFIFDLIAYSIILPSIGLIFRFRKWLQKK